MLMEKVERWRGGWTSETRPDGKSPHPKQYIHKNYVHYIQVHEQNFKEKTQIILVPLKTA